MERYSIKDLEKLSGINANTIRVWERRYKIIKPSRTDTNRRRYSDEELRKIINISILKRHGIKISLIATLADKDIEEKVAFILKETNSYDTKIESLVILMVRHDENGINDLLIRSIINIGFEETLTGIVFPFFKRIGIMWLTGSSVIDSEHFFSNIIRQRIILATDSLSSAVKEGRKRAILFLPENELHEIVLLYYNYIIRKLGHETIYLGQSTPVKSVADVNNTWRADIIVTGLMSGFPDLTPEELISQLGTLFPHQKVLVSGLIADLTPKSKYSNIYPVRSAEELKSHFK